MNWDAISFDWNHVRAFLATVEHGSLSGAARALGRSQPTLSRQISALEDELQLTLLERGTRVTELTDSGAELLAFVRNMADAATQISRVAAGQNKSVEGSVRITSSDAMAAYSLPRCLIELRQRFPGISFEVIASNDTQDLTRRDADIAIRHVRPDQPDLIAKRLPDIQISLYATEGYLRSLGPIAHLQDLKVANFIGYANPQRLVPQVQALGIPVEVPNFGLTANSGPAMFELVRQGAGIAFLPQVFAERDLGLCKAHADVPLFPMETWLVTHREIQTSRRIRLTFDHLAETLSRDKWHTGFAAG